MSWASIRPRKPRTSSAVISGGRNDSVIAARSATSLVMAHHATQTGSRQSFRSYPRSEAAWSPGAESRELEEEGSHGNSQGGETRRVAQGTEETPDEGEGVQPDA